MNRNLNCPSDRQQDSTALDSLEQLELEDERNFNSCDRPSTVTIALVIKLLPLGLTTLTLLYLLYLGGEVAKLRQGHERVLVQTVSGRSIVAEPVDNYLRTPATIEKTVKLWTDLTFNWVQKLPDGKRDLGIKVGTKTFPTRLVQGSTLLSKELQQIWCEVFQQRDDYLPRNFLGSSATRLFFPSLQTAPKPPLDSRTGRGIENRYEVEVYGDWVEYSAETPQGKLIDRLALKLRLRPVVKTEPSLSEDADSLQKAAYELRANGLEMYDIQRIPYER